MTGKRGYIGGNFGLPHRDFSYDEAYAGKGEDGWTPRANGMINCSEQIDLDDLGFLCKGPSVEVSINQREGSVSIVAYSLVLHLADPVEPSST